MKSHQEPEHLESSAEHALRQLTSLEHCEPSRDRSAAGLEIDASARSFRSVLLGWTDPETGDRLSVRMDGSRSLVSQLQEQGFEVLASDENESLPASQADSSNEAYGAETGSFESRSGNTTSFTARLLSVRHRLGRRNSA